MASVGERIQEGNAALARGAWAEARAIFEQELEARARQSTPSKG